MEKDFIRLENHLKTKFKILFLYDSLYISKLSQKKGAKLERYKLLGKSNAMFGVNVKAFFII